MSERARPVLTLTHTLDLGLDIVDGIGRLHLKGDSLAREGLDENLHVEDLIKSGACKGESFFERLTSTEMSSSILTMQKVNGDAGKVR
jgi:hypothetical protein